MFGQFVEKFSWLWYTKPYYSTMQYCFVDKNLVVRLSTTKTTKNLPPEKYPLYSMSTCISEHSTKLYYGTMRYCFVGKNFMVRLSTMKTTKILPPEKYPLYGMSTCISEHRVCCLRESSVIGTLQQVMGPE